MLEAPDLISNGTVLRLTIDLFARSSTLAIAVTLCHTQNI